jgi:hypothetical protein
LDKHDSIVKLHIIDVSGEIDARNVRDQWCEKIILKSPGVSRNTELTIVDVQDYFP